MLGQAQLNATSMHATSYKKSQIKIRNLEKVQALEVSSPKPRIKLQRLHKMRHPASQIEVEDTSTMLFEILEDDQCPVTFPMLGQAQLNATSMHATSYKKSQIKIRNLEKVQALEVSSPKPRIKLQRPHKMRHPGSQIEVEDTSRMLFEVLEDDQCP